MNVYIPKRLTEDELKEYLTPEVMILVSTFFQHNPKKTVFKVSDKKHKVSIRRFEYGKQVRYTITTG